MNKLDLERLEIELVLKTVSRVYGYDFSNYSSASLKRRIVHFVAKSGYQQISEIIPHIIHNRDFFFSLLFTISVTVTEMFRDPEVYKFLRATVLPVLKTYPSIRVWHAGCATGEEVYSLAIMLAEEGLAERAQIYATDINDLALQKAREGIFSIDRIKEYTANYQKAGGTRSLSEYYQAGYDSVIMDKKLKKNIVFASHNLVSDAAFGEMHLIFCRNVLIYFDEFLQDKVLNLFLNSLVPKGFLCLGTKESLHFTSCKERFRQISEKEKCFQVN